MKLSTKLKISFAVLILVPVMFCIIGFICLFNFKLYAMNVQYNVNGTTYEVFLNPVQMASTTCGEQYHQLIEDAGQSPDSLTDEEYLNSINEQLTKSGAYLLVILEDNTLFVGEEDGEEIADELASVDFSNQTEAGIYLSEYQVLINRVEFSTTDGQNGEACVVMHVGNVLPQMKRILVDSVGAILIALILTSAIFTVWIYRETIKPIDKLRLATRNIKDGNLDFDIDTTGKDEFSDLCRDFDAMRLQLKKDQEEKVAADAESKELISNISHDLKTPITSIKGYVEGIMDGVANTPEKREKYIKIIYNKACEMDSLINELTFYSKIDNGKIPYNFVKLDVAEYFADCVEEIGIDLESRGFAFGYTCDVADGTLVAADPEQLRRVIHNIVNNSVKYAQKTPARISLHLKEDEDHVYIALSDNGIGIDEKDVPYIFDRFYRSDASRNSKTGGSGIGLSIVKKIVEDHNGTITCESVVGEGTTMHITLPKVKEEEAPQQDVPRLAP